MARRKKQLTQAQIDWRNSILIGKVNAIKITEPVPILFKMKKRKRCKKCIKLKSLKAFYKKADMRDKHSNECIQCTRERNNANYHEKMKEILFAESERHRRLEKYHRGQKQSLLNKINQLL